MVHEADEGAAPAAALQEAREPLGWNGVAAIAILLVAAVSVRDRVSDLSPVHFVLRATWWLIYALAAARLVRQSGTEWLRWTVRYEPALCVLLGLALASCFWSLDPSYSFRKAASLLGTTMVGVFIGYTCPPPRLMRVLLWTFLLLILSGILAELVLPALPMLPGQSIGWRGIMGHKNTFGAVAVWATILFLVLGLRRGLRPIWAITLCTASVFALLQTRSRTSLATLLLSLAALVYLETRRPSPARLRRLALGLVLFVAVVPFLLAPLATPVGDADPLNGRLRLWGGARIIAQARPATGYGYAAVWGRSVDTLLPHIAITRHRSAANAHNGIANVVTELGIPAGILACAYLFGALSNAARLWQRRPSAFSFFALVFLIAFVVMNFAEAHLLVIHWFFWILCVALCVTVRRSLHADATAAARPVAEPR